MRFDVGRMRLGLLCDVSGPEFRPLGAISFFFATKFTLLVQLICPWPNTGLSPWEVAPASGLRTTMPQDSVSLVEPPPSCRAAGASAAGATYTPSTNKSTQSRKRKSVDIGRRDTRVVDEVYFHSYMPQLALPD